MTPPSSASSSSLSRSSIGSDVSRRLDLARLGGSPTPAASSPLSTDPPDVLLERVSAKLWRAGKLESLERILLVSHSRLQLVELATSRASHTWLLGDVAAVEWPAGSAELIVRLKGGFKWERDLTFMLQDAERARSVHGILIRRSAQQWSVPISPIKRGRGSLEVASSLGGGRQ